MGNKMTDAATEEMINQINDLSKDLYDVTMVYCKTNLNDDNIEFKAVLNLVLSSYISGLLNTLSILASVDKNAQKEIHKFNKDFKEHLKKFDGLKYITQE